jgi:mycofactocin precursor peptide peptidase
VSDAVPGHRLAELAWTEVPEPSLLVVPLGSCEQHGPHLPLDTDLRIAEHLASRLVQERSDAVLAPSITVGASGEHQSFPGTLSIGTAALELLLVELVRSALPEPGDGRPAPFRGVVLVNGHGGNVEACVAASSVLAAEGRALLVWHPVVPDGDSHAGRTETSMLLHLDPACVRVDRWEPGSTARWRQIGPVLRADGLAAVSPNGILGDPTTATVAEGERVVGELVVALDDAVRTRFGPPG